MTHSASVTRFGARQRKLGVAVWLAALMSVVGSAVAQQAAAPVQSYDVELLIFRNLGGRETPENWGTEAAGAAQRLDIPEDELSSSELADVPTVAAPTVTFPALPAAKMKLTAVEDTMRRNRSYQPLAHIGWTQPGFARDSAKYLSLSSLVPGSSGLQGQVALSRGRYLHLTLDLTLDSAEDGQRYVLRQTRRMRSNERHYLDSPKFGVIAIITPSGETTSP
ncbi:MAG TPA: CsiV family protein [Steroidobacter sp.]|uniref:CsiV family protein n=1 Tax=Steroidobacter sp. TaxID=1978227 RepID=UPI002ED8C886